MAKKLLLADDSITIQKVVSLTFAEEEFDVVCVGNGEIAIEKIRENPPDIVLADIFMPRKTGYEVCEFVKTNPEFSHIPVILLVGTFEPFDKAEAARVGAENHLTKPFETTTLIQMVKDSVADTAVPAEASPPPRDLEGDRTIQISFDELQEHLTPVPEAKPEVSDEIPVQEPEMNLPVDETEETMSEVDLAPDEIILDDAPAPDMELEEVSTAGPEEDYVSEFSFAEEPADAEPVMAAPAAPLDEEPPTGEDLLDIPAIDRKVTRPTDEDILGVFDLIDLDGIIARQRSVEEALKLEMAPPVETRVETITEPEPVEADLPVDELPEMVDDVDEIREPVVPEVTEEVPQPAAASVSGETVLTEDLVTRIASLVVEKLSEKVVREIAWEVVPELSELMIKQEIEKMKRDGRI